VAEKNFGSQAISAFKTGLAAVLCVWLGNLLGLEHSWAAVSAIVVMVVDNTLLPRAATASSALQSVPSWAGLPGLSGTATTFCMDWRWLSVSLFAAYWRMTKLDDSLPSRYPSSFWSKSMAAPPRPQSEDFWRLDLELLSLSW
jgi:hypothetical protein